MLRCNLAQFVLGFMAVTVTDDSFVYLSSYEKIVSHETNKKINIDNGISWWFGLIVVFGLKISKKRALGSKVAARFHKLILI